MLMRFATGFVLKCHDSHVHNQSSELLMKFLHLEFSDFQPYIIILAVLAVAYRLAGLAVLLIRVYLTKPF